MFWFIAVIFLIALSFYLGFRIGRKNHSVETKAKQQAWQEGYLAASNYAARAGSKPVAPVPNPEPFSVPPPAPASAPPVQPWMPAQKPQVQLTPPAPIAPTRVVKQLSPRERELRNINVTLYVAALLIVAAGALFLSFALPPLPKLIALFVLAAAFYGAGLYIHGAKANLKPAASAFAGTGLALLPLSGIATYLTLPISAALVWLIFSVIGTLAVGYATLRLRSRVLAWLAVFVLVSSTMACAATVQRGILYYLLFLLLLSLLLLLLAVRSSKLRGSLFYSAVFATGQLLPLLVAGLGIVLINELNYRDLIWVFFLVTAHLLLSIRLLEQFRFYRLVGARASFMLLVFASANYLDFAPRTTWMLLAILWAAQAAGVAHYANGYRKIFSVPTSWWRTERIILWALTGIFALGALLTDQQQVTGWWYATVLVVILQAFTLPALVKRAKIETVALVLFVVLALFATEGSAWRMLPSVALALLGLSLAAAHGPVGRWRLGLAQTRWLMVLVFGGFLGATLQQILIADTRPGNGAPWIENIAWHNPSLQLAWVIGFFLPLLVLWFRSTLRASGEQVKLIRLASSAALALLALGYLGYLHSADTTGGVGAAIFLALHAGTWFTVGIILTLASVLLAGWRQQSQSGNREVEFQRLLVLGTSVALLLLSFLAPIELVPVVALANILFYLRAARGSTTAGWKGLYAAAAQLSFTLGIWWFVDFMALDAYGRFALLLVSVMVPQLLRLFLAMRVGVTLSREMRWITVTLVIGLPLVLIVAGMYFSPLDRGTTVLGLSLWTIHSVKGFVALRRQMKYAQYLLFATVMGLSILLYLQGASGLSQVGWIHGPWWSVTTSKVLLLVLSLGALSVQWPLRREIELRYAPVFGTIFPLLTVAGIDSHPGWFALILLIIALQFGLLVHTRAIGWLALGASLALFMALGSGIEFWLGAKISGPYPWMDMTWQLLFTAILLLICALLHGRFSEPVPGYRVQNAVNETAGAVAARFYFAMMILAVFAAGMLLHFNELRTLGIISGALLLAVAAALVRFCELPAAWQRWGSDGLLLFLGFLGLSSYAQIRSMPELSMIFLYFTVLLCLLALRHFVAKQPVYATGYVVAAAVLASLTQVSTLADSNPLAQGFSLFFFAGLIVLGLKLGQKRFIWWGAIAITVAVLWFLRYLAFLWLVLAGIALIVAAVLKLVRVERKPRGDAEPGEQDPSQGQHDGGDYSNHEH